MKDASQERELGRKNNGRPIETKKGGKSILLVESKCARLIPRNAVRGLSCRGCRFQAAGDIPLDANANENEHTACFRS